MVWGDQKGLGRNNSIVRKKKIDAMFKLTNVRQLTNYYDWSGWGFRMGPTLSCCSYGGLGGE